MTIRSPSTGNIALELRPREILPTQGEQIVMLTSHKGNNCILFRFKKILNRRQRCPATAYNINHCKDFTAQCFIYKSIGVKR